MDRRAFLLGAAALAGCSSGDPAETTPTLTPVALADTPSPTPTLDPDAEPPITNPWYLQTSLVDLTGLPRTLALHPRPVSRADLSASARFVAADTPEEPALVEVVLFNAGEDPVSVPTTKVPPLTDFVGRSESGALLLAPQTYPRERVGECWRAGALPFPSRAETTISPGGSVGSTLAVLDHPDNDDCLPTGRYRFRTGWGWEFTVGVWRTEAPGPAQQSTLFGRDVPDLPGTGPTAWFHWADFRTPVFLRPERERVTLPVGSLSLTLQNHSRSALVGNPLAWTLFKYHEEGWKRIAPRDTPTPRTALPPGDRLAWAVQLSGGAIDDVTAALAVGHLGGGTYAVSAGLAPESEPVTYAALLDVSGPPVAVTPTDGLTTSKDGSFIEVSSSEADPRGDFTPFDLVRVSNPDGPTLIPEQVMQVRGLRNTLGFVDEGIRRVRLQTSYAVVREVFELVPERFTFAGEGFELRR